ncbi:MAG TPA: BON domain-containing protein [Steroidobacteraceae bacterium]|nr:BON domain-containing protein [Steroidobacteraceae bacterium]
MAARHDRSGSLPAPALAVVALVASPALRAQQPVPAPASAPPEVVISATRESDAVLVAKVEQAMQNDPYLFVSHISVSADKGVVRVEGVVQDPFDMLQIVRMARRIAGKRRVINEIEVADPGVDHD